MKNILSGAALCLGLSAAAHAQTLSCIAQPVDTPALRDNGVTERVGDLKIVCTGGTPTPVGVKVPQFNLQISTSPAVNITSRILADFVSEALLLIDEPAPGIQTLCGSTVNQATERPAVCGIDGNGTGIGVYDGSVVVANAGVVTRRGRPNAFVGRRFGENSISWTAIPFDPPGAGPARVLRITNIRINATQLNNTRGGATAVNLILSTGEGNIINPIQVPIGNPAPTVGIAQSAMDVSVAGVTFQQCESQNYTSGVLANALASQMSITFSERFASAFRRRSAAAPTDATLVPTPAESNLLNFSSASSESGFYKIPNSTTWNLDLIRLGAQPTTTKLGLADSGTRLVARFKNLPVGVTLYAANHARLNQINASIFTGTVHGTFADAGGGGSYSSVGLLTGYTPMAGTGTFTWEVIGTDTTVTERVTIPLALAFLANTSNSLPGLGAATADGQPAPLSNAATASETAAIPRFTEDTANNDKLLFSLAGCPPCPPVIGVNRGGAQTGCLPVGGATPTPTPTPTPAPTPTPTPPPGCVPTTGPNRGGVPCSAPPVPDPGPTPDPGPMPPPTPPPGGACVPAGVPNRSGLPAC